jgi:anti-sigma factor RsiW
MVTDACRDWRNELAAMAAGRPDPVRATGLAAHLEGCPHCREDLAELAPVAQALHLVDPDRLTDPPAPPEGLGRSVVSAVSAVRRSEARAARWRRAAIAAAAVAGAAAVLAGVLALSTRTEGPETFVAFTTAPEGVVASVELTEATWGTQIALDVDGLDTEADDVYWLWLSASDGDRVAAGTFRGDGHMQMSAALPLDDARRVWVTDEDDAVVFDAPVD